MGRGVWLFSLVVVSTCPILFLPVQTNAQASNEAGVKLYGSYHGSEIDNVSLTSGHVELNIPLLDLPSAGRQIGAFFHHPLPHRRVESDKGLLAAAMYLHMGQ